MPAPRTTIATMAGPGHNSMSGPGHKIGTGNSAIDHSLSKIVESSDMREIVQWGCRAFLQDHKLEEDKVNDSKSELQINYLVYSYKPSEYISERVGYI
jgi:hypothetical protein